MRRRDHQHKHFFKVHDGDDRNDGGDGGSSDGGDCGCSGSVDGVCVGSGSDEDACGHLPNHVCITLTFLIKNQYQCTGLFPLALHFSF